MCVETLIRHRTQKKEIRLSGALAMSKTAWEQRAGIYHDSLGNAAKEGWYTVRNCEIMGVPVTDEEFQNCKDFAIFQGCYSENLIVIDGKNRVPCLPVFYRDKKDIWVLLCMKLPDGTWSKPCGGGQLSAAELLVKARPDEYKIAGYTKERL